MELTEEQFQRYARHLILDEVGEEGQVRLLSSRVLVVGAGGLGSPLLLYLAAAGVGTLGITDPDRVDLTNLQRQIVHATERVGTLKVDSARHTLAAVNPGVRVETHPLRLGPDNAEVLIRDYDVVADGSDNFETRYLLTDLCCRLEKPSRRRFRRSRASSRLSSPISDPVTLATAVCSASRRLRISSPAARPPAFSELSPACSAPCRR